MIVKLIGYLFLRDINHDTYQYSEYTSNHLLLLPIWLSIFLGVFVHSYPSNICYISFKPNTLIPLHISVLLNTAFFIKSTPQLSMQTRLKKTENCLQTQHSHTYKNTHIFTNRQHIITPCKLIQMYTKRAELCTCA